MKYLTVLLLLLSAQAMATVEVSDAQFSADADRNIGHISFTLSGPANYRVFSLSDPARVVIDIRDARLSGALHGISFSGSPVRTLRSASRNGSDLRIVLDLNSGAALKSYALRVMNNREHKLQIDLQQTVAAHDDTPQATVAQAPADPVAKSMEEARQAMANNNYTQAIALYQKILKYPPNSYTQDALEYLGVARERNGNLALARITYKDYLKRYPQSAGTERVRQRLFGLATAQAPAQKKLPDKQRPLAHAGWNVYSSLSQYYRHDSTAANGASAVATQSALTTNLDASGQLRRTDYELRTRFSGGYLNDFLNDNKKDLLNISNLYIDAATAYHDWSGRVGRQSQTSGGVLGRFDGLSLSYRLNPFVKLNAVSGYPVDLMAPDRINSDTAFYGVNFDLGTFANTWNFNAFAIEQTSQGLLDRRALGGEIQYVLRNYSVFGLLDYDIAFNVLNTAMLLGNWTFADNATLNFVAAHGKNPTFIVRNALIGQGTTSLAVLAQSFSETEMQALAKDRTPDSTNYTLHFSYPLNAKLFVGGDLNLSTISATPASGGVEGMPADRDNSFGLQLISYGLIKQGDMNILGVRQNNNSSSDTTSLNLLLRYPIAAWRLSPWLRIDQRRYAVDGSHKWSLAPAFRATYQWEKRIQLEGEAGGEWSIHDTAGTTDKSREFYFSLGYRIEF
jgi:tetratricopeptide (TPR) repeat protein